MRKYKYRFDYNKVDAGNEEWINSIGDDGWELVTVLHDTDRADYFLFIFKKPE